MQKRIKKTLDKLDEDEEDELWAASVRETVTRLTSQAGFVEDMQKLDFHTHLVPGDGDCSIWTLLALEGGPLAGAQLATQKDIMHRRKESRQTDLCFVHIFPVSASALWMIWDNPWRHIHIMPYPYKILQNLPSGKQLYKMILQTRNWPNSGDR